MAQIIAIDQSTSATKALLYDTTGRLIDKVSREHRQIYPRPGLVEHDAAEIWANTQAVLAEIAGRAADPICLSITNQRETFVIFDRATGEPLHNAVVWQCRRGDGVCAELRAAGCEKTISSKTGLRIDTYFSAPKLAQLLRDRPDIAAALASGRALFGTIDAYLIYRLTGGKSFCTDHTNASRTLLLDIRRLRWDEELCALFGVPMNCLPEVRDSTAQFGTTDLGGKLPRPLPICGVMGDSQASLLAHRCFEPGAGKATLGSGSSVLLNIGPVYRDGGEGAVTTIAWTHRGSATYCFEGIINYAAATISWLKDQLGLIASPHETEAAAAAVADNGGVYLVPAFAGLSAPYWSPGARAAIVGMTAHANRNHIIRAALESIAYQLADVLEMMRSRAGVESRDLHADGGATGNRFLMQFIADITARRILAAVIPDGSPLGAALAGMLGMGVHSDWSDLAALSHDAAVYQPAMPPDRAAAFRAEWQVAVRQVLAGATPQ